MADKGIFISNGQILQGEAAKEARSKAKSENLLKALVEPLLPQEQDAHQQEDDQPSPTEADSLEDPSDSHKELVQTSDPNRTHQSNLYINSNGQILEGRAARKAKFQAKIQEIKRDLPPPMFPITLKQTVEATPNPEDSSNLQSMSMSSGHQQELSPSDDCSHPISKSNSDQQDSPSDHHSFSDSNSHLQDSPSDDHSHSESNSDQQDSPSDYHSSLTDSEEDSEDDDHVELNQNIKNKVHIKYKIFDGYVKPQENNLKREKIVEYKTADIKLFNAYLIGNKNEVSTTSGVELIPADVEMITIKGSLVSTETSTSHTVRANGVKIDAGIAELNGAKISLSAKTSAEAKGINAQTGHLEISGAEGKLNVNASGSADGATIETGNAKLTGTEISASAKGSAEVNGINLKTGNLEADGVITGASANANADVTGVDLKVGNVQATGIDATASVSASVSAGTTLQANNVTFCGFDGFGLTVSVDTKIGVVANSFSIGISGRTGVVISPVIQTGGFSIRIGPPMLVLTPCSTNSRGFGIPGIVGRSVARGGGSTRNNGKRINGGAGGNGGGRRGNGGDRGNGGAGGNGDGHHGNSGHRGQGIGSNGKNSHKIDLREKGPDRQPEEDIKKAPSQPSHIDFLDTIITNHQHLSSNEGGSMEGVNPSLRGRRPGILGLSFSVKESSNNPLPQQLNKPYCVHGEKHTLTDGILL